MDYSYTTNAGLPKIRTIPPVSKPEDEPVSHQNVVVGSAKSSSMHQTTQTQTPTSSTSSYQPTSTIPPTIDEVLTGVSPLPYTRNHFLQYLVQRHCLENLEFYLEIQKFCQLENYAEREFNWRYMYNNYIEIDSPKEINLPASIRDNFSLMCVPDTGDTSLQDAAKTVFDYLHEAYVGFLSSTEQLQLRFNQQYSHFPAPTPVSRRDSPVSHLGNVNATSSRCISPLSPSESLSNATQLPRNVSPDENELPFEMSDDDDDMGIEDAQQRERKPSNVTVGLDTEDTVTRSGRNSSVSSGHSSSNAYKSSSLVGSFKSSNDSNWKKLAKKFKWRRSSYSKNSYSSSE